MRENIFAIGYDIDGTMVDSEPLHVAAWQETITSNGHDFADLPIDFQNSMAGRKPIAIASFMVESLRINKSPEDFLAQKHANFMHKVRSDLRPMPGVVESVHRLGKFFRLGIGTSLDRDYAELVLNALGVHDEFDAIVSGNEINRGKPDPETYLVLASKLGIMPNEMAVLEDAKSGIESAKEAGCYCVAVENILVVKQDTNRADAVVRSLQDVTVNLIRGLGQV